MSRFEPTVRWWSATTRSLSRFAPARRPHAGRRLRLECLEDRTMLSTVALAVNSQFDDPSGPTPGYTTLRDAITQADADPTNSYLISFSVKGTIGLFDSLPALSNNIAIEGPGTSDLIVQRYTYDSQFSVFTVDAGVTVSLSGMTITGGNAVDGGGIYNAGTLTVDDCTLTNNSTSTGGDVLNYGSGGGLYNVGTATVSNSTFTNNSAGINTGIGKNIFNYSFGSGGGIENGGTLTVSDSTFSGNSAIGGYSGGNGGGIDSDSLLTVSNCTFTSNYAGYAGYLGSGGYTPAVGSGGGISGEGIVSDCTFTDNFAGDEGGGFSGGGILTNCTFTGNGANGFSMAFGGGLYSSGTLMVTDSSFTNNSIFAFLGNVGIGDNSGDGGGIYNGGTLTMANCTFSNDDCGLYNDGTATLTNCTVSGNTSPAAGGIYNGGNLTLNNTIVAGNTSTATSDNDISGQVEPTSAYNLIGDGSGITNLSELDSSNLIGTAADPINPLLGPLADYGGPTQTMALLPGSPAIDAGSNALAVDANGNPLTTDQRGAGFPRVINGSVDIGAFESQGFTLTPVTGSTPQGTPVNSPFANPLAVIVTANNPLEPVAGGIVTFSAPAGGASASLSTTNPVTIGSNGQASVTATANAIGGQYTVSASTAGAAAPASFVLTNQFLSQTISFGPLAGQTYGVAPITLSATDTSDLPVSFTVLSGPATLSGSVLTVNGAGNVVVEASQPGNATYSAAAPVDESFTVNPAPLIMTATGESMTYGGTVPALTYTYTGLANGDTSATFNGSLVTAATSSSSVGDYPITVGTLVATGNYTVGTYNPSILTIAKADTIITVTPYSVTYDGNVHNASGTSLTGLVINSAHTNAGTYTDSWTYTDPNGNYNSQTGIITDTIAKANANISVIGYNTFYNAAPHAATGAVYGVNGTTLSGLNLGGTVHTNVGTYADVWTFTDITDNYNNASGVVTDTITPSKSKMVKETVNVPKTTVVKATVLVPVVKEVKVVERDWVGNKWVKKTVLVPETVLVRKTVLVNETKMVKKTKMVKVYYS